MDWDNALLQEPPSLPMMSLLYGDAKVGKTELAATWPKPIIMAFENPGPTISGRKDLKITPLIYSFDDAIGFLTFLYKTPNHGFETLIIETITKMNKMFETEIITTDPKKSNNMGEAWGGYGKAYGILAEMHGRILKACEALRRDRGMNIVFVGHVDISKFSPPDGEGYNIYKLDMHTDSEKHYVNNSDVIGFISQKTMTRKGEDKKTIVASTDQRILTCKSSAAHVSGNRYGIVDDIVLEKGVNPLLKYLNVNRKGA